LILMEYTRMIRMIQVKGLHSVEVVVEVIMEVGILTIDLLHVDTTMGVEHLLQWDTIQLEQQ
jgi:hypothetical protein